MESFIHILGCGDAFASGGRANTSFLVSHLGKKILLDCGSTTLTKLKACGYCFQEISGIAISHFHGDHFGGIPNLILDAEFGNHKSKGFFITSPKEGKKRISDLMECLYPGTSNLIDKQNITFHYYIDKEEIDLDFCKISALPVVHTPESYPHGIRLTIDDFIIAFSGDTMWTDNLIELSESADIFIVDCNFLTNRGVNHLDYETLTQNLHRLNAGKIYLTHMGEEVLNSAEVEIEKLNDGQFILLSK